MKFLVSLIAVTLLSPAVFAIPAVGDYAKYALSVNVSGGSETGTLELSLTAFDQATNTYTEHLVITDQNGNTIPQDQTVDAASLPSDDLLNNLATQCGPAGGTLGSTTVPAGTFNTCTVPVNNNGSTGTTMVGAVPFGIVQTTVTSSDGQTTQLALISYTSGIAKK